MKKLAIILLSGGMDSLTTLAIAINSGYTPCVLHVSYGQATQRKELDAFHNISDYYNIPNHHKLIVDIDYLRQIGGSSLTSKNVKMEISDDIPNSYVPFRNANLLAIATSWAEIIDANAIFIGASEVDFSGYPDCRRIFFDAFEKSIQYGTKSGNGIKIITPIISKTKSVAIKTAVHLQAPLELSWSCYYSNDLACGECPSCTLRLAGFKQAGIKDQIKYKSSIDL